jgi:carboxyl-terminal processing protease
MNRKTIFPTIAALLACLLLAAPAAQAQRLTSDDQGLLKDMLHDAYSNIKKHYYDPKLHGVDWDGRFKYYQSEIAKSTNWGQGFGIMAELIDELKDSHTRFYPPRRAARIETGFRYSLVGDRAFITQVRPDTDAASKLHVGDEIVRLEALRVDRASIDNVHYYIDMLSPRTSYSVHFRSPAGDESTVLVNSIIKNDKRTIDYSSGHDLVDDIRRAQDENDTQRSIYLEDGDMTIWKMRGFYHSIDQIEKIIGMAHKHPTLILDLRGNHGGAVETLQLVIGSLFDHEIKIADRVGRTAKDSKPLKSLPHGKPFTGKLIVLVDSESASCSELLARVVQLEHRGTVIGDKTAGAVMESADYDASQGGDSKIGYDFQITSANLLMADGKSLENVGVTPDELMLPTADDLAAGRDPVLSHAADLGGLKLDPVEAGKMFPYPWLPL